MSQESFVSFTLEEYLSLFEHTENPNVRIGEHTHRIPVESTRHRLLMREHACRACGLEVTSVQFGVFKENQHTPKLQLFGDRDGKSILMTIDHIVPKSRGGGNDLDNLALCCHPCNNLKAYAEITYEDVQVLQKLHDLYRCLPRSQRVDNMKAARRLMQRHRLRGESRSYLPVVELLQSNSMPFHEAISQVGEISQEPYLKCITLPSAEGENLHVPYMHNGECVRVERLDSLAIDPPPQWHTTGSLPLNEWCTITRSPDCVCCGARAEWLALFVCNKQRSYRFLGRQGNQVFRVMHVRNKYTEQRETWCVPCKDLRIHPFLTPEDVRHLRSLRDEAISQNKPFRKLVQEERVRLIALREAQRATPNPDAFQFIVPETIPWISCMTTEDVQRQAIEA